MQNPTPGQVRAARAALTGVVLLLLLGVVALASRGGFGHNSQAAPSASYVSYAMTLFVIVFVLLIPVTLYLRLMEMRQVAPGERQSFWRRLLAPLLLLLVLAGLARLIYYVYEHRHRYRFHPVTSPGAAGGKGSAAHKALHRIPVQPHFEWNLFWIAVAVIAVASVAAFVWYRTRPPLAPLLPEEEPTVAQDLAVSIEGAIGDLEAEPDARRAVIAAYARMEGVLARNGLRRQPSETPLEYLRHVLNGLTTRGDAVTRLTGLFEEAKFSRHEIGTPEKRDAIAALHEIRDDLQPRAA